MRFHFFVTFCLLIFLTKNTQNGAWAARWLDDFVSYYEITEQENLQRNRRSSSLDGKTGEFLHEVRAFNKSFLLKLHPNTSSFTADHVIEFGDGKPPAFDVDLSFFLVAGKVVGHEDDSSDVHGSLVDDRFEGKIFVDGVTYIVENAEKFAKHKYLSTLSSIVYRTSDVTMEGGSPTSPVNARRRRSAAAADGGGAGGYSTCGWSHEEISSQLHPNQQAVDDGHLLNNNLNSRKRREAPTSAQPVVIISDPKAMPKVCEIFMQVDHLLYNKFYQETKSDFSAVVNIMAYLDYVTKTTNNIYHETNFSTADGNTGPFKNVQMAVVRTKIYKTESEFALGFQLRPAEQIQNLDPTNFLNLVSRNNYDMYCASFIFTLRDFSNGVLGLAWIHYPDMMQRGGVCDRYGPTRYGLQSLNAGIVTQLNYGEFVSRHVSATTFAHELGHSFGAQHDNTPSDGQIKDPKCYPGGSEGNYIMYSSANSGDKPNNQKFSFCSRDSIAKNLQQIVTNPAALNCFKTSVQFCGNGIVDQGEECDCGFSDDCGMDARCCGPADDPNPQARCRLKKTVNSMPVQCSLSNGGCCDVKTCSFRSKQSSYVCRQADDCYQDAYCDGKSPVCPKGTPERDGKLCGDMTKMCRNGECAASSCEAIIDSRSATKEVFTGCQPERPADQANYNRSELCYLACRSPSSGICYNSAGITGKSFDKDFRAFLSRANGDQPIQLMAGAPCDNDRGYCDVFRKCRPVNTDGPLARLRDVLFSDSSIETLKSWIENHWWAVMLIGIGVIAFMIAFVKLCSVHTPSDNRQFRPARAFVQTFRRTSFRPVLGNSGPPQGRGHGHQRVSVPSSANSVTTVATVSQSVASSPSVRPGSSNKDLTNSDSKSKPKKSSSPRAKSTTSSSPLTPSSGVDTLPRPTLPPASNNSQHQQQLAPAGADHAETVAL